MTTTYLWYSKEAATRDRQDGPKQGFNRASRSESWVYYLNSKDWPVRVTLVGHTPEHETGFKDIELLDAVKGEAACVLVRGVLQKSGEQWCRRHGFAVDAKSIVDQSEAIIIHKPLTFKKPAV